MITAHRARNGNPLIMRMNSNYCICKRSVIYCTSKKMTSMPLDSQRILEEMEDVGTVVLEVKDIDWETGTIPTFDDVKVEEITSVNYMGVHDDNSNCSENIAEGNNVDVIESVIIGSSQEKIKELTFSPVPGDRLKSDPIDVKEMIQFVTGSERGGVGTLDTSDLKQQCDLEMKSMAMHDLPQRTTKCINTGKRKKYVIPQKFSCELCHLKFVSHCSLQIHIRRHMGYKPFSCEVCQQAYPTKTQMRRHMKTHTNKLEHFCGECGKSALDISTLKKHARLKHGANKDTYNLYRMKEEISNEGEKIIFIKTYRNGETNIRRFRLLEDPEHDKYTQ
ncbi:hypothetical protein SK128_007457 [Halocaridina rubra]|uniref:C2H2-type domain-containing protein n=1 Tax=Halocaridina rubra TaxID=373956 RepID=A0AAN9AE34_HALRR